MPDEQEIPQSLREKIDYFLAGELEKTRIKEWRSKMGDIYFKESNFYALNKNKATKYDREIIKDITRTFPSEKLFQDTSLQIKMFHIVRTYCFLDQDLGYCQGMCFPVGCILKYFSESDAFCIFTFIMRDMRVKNLYEIESGSLSFLKKTFLSALKKHSPAMHKKIIDLKYEIDLILIPWTVALGCSLLNYNNIIEIIDLILIFGPTAIFDLIISIICICEKDIIKLESKVEIHSFLRYKIPDVYINQKYGVIMKFSNFIETETFTDTIDTLIDHLDEGNRFKKREEKLYLPEAATESVINCFTDITINLLEENSKLRSRLFMQNHTINGDSLKTSDPNSNKTHHNVDTSSLFIDSNYCNVCRVKEFELCDKIDKTKELFHSFDKVQNNLKKLIECIRSELTNNDCKPNDNSTLHLYDSLMDSTASNAKLKGKIIELEYQLNNIESKYLHVLRGQNIEEDRAKRS